MGHIKTYVLIPLLVDVPLWAFEKRHQQNIEIVLIPLLVDVPLWAKNPRCILCTICQVLIPLLVDVPLWAEEINMEAQRIVS